MWSSSFSLPFCFSHFVFRLTQMKSCPEGFLFNRERSFLIKQKRHSTECLLLIWNLCSHTETLLTGTGNTPAVPPCLFSMENHLHSCDDNGITGPDWGRSEVVFSHAVQQDLPTLRSLSADAPTAYCPLQRFVYTGYSTAGGLAVSSIESMFDLQNTCKNPSTVIKWINFSKKLTIQRLTLCDI